jgi:hypothetical protein
VKTSSMMPMSCTSPPKDGQQALRGQQPVEEVLGELGPVRRDQDQRRQHHGQPGDRADPAEDRPHHWKRPREKALRVEQRNADGERTHQLSLPLLTLVLLPPLEQLRGVGGHVALQHVGGVELAEELDHLVLRRRVVAQLGGGQAPDLVDGAALGHQSDHEVGGGREAQEAVVHRVLQHVPELAPVVVTMDAGVRAETRGELLYPIPVGAEERLGHAAPP